MINQFKIKQRACPTKPWRSGGFALIYAILIVALVSITIIAVTNVVLTEIKQTRKIHYTAGAYQVAKAGMEDGLANYQMGQRIDPVANSTESSRLWYLAGTTDDSQGHYQMVEIKSSTITDTGKVKVIGYFKESVIALEATIPANNPENDVAGNTIKQVGA